MTLQRLQIPDREDDTAGFEKADRIPRARNASVAGWRRDRPWWAAFA